MSPVISTGHRRRPWNRDIEGQHRNHAESAAHQVEAAFDGGDSGEVLIPGSSNESELFRRITSEDADELMPPETERR